MKNTKRKVLRKFSNFKLILRNHTLKDIWGEKITSIPTATWLSVFLAWQLNALPLFWHCPGNRESISEMHLRGLGEHTGISNHTSEIECTPRSVQPGTMDSDAKTCTRTTISKKLLNTDGQEISRDISFLSRNIQIFLFYQKRKLRQFLSPPVSNGTSDQHCRTFHIPAPKTASFTCAPTRVMVYFLINKQINK